MNLSQAIFKVNSIYSKVKRYIFSFLEKKRPTQKQLDDLTTKIDLVGGGAAAQSLIWQAQSTWLSLMMIVISFTFCVILWVTTFIMKGYDYEQRNRNSHFRCAHRGHYGLYSDRRRKSVKRKRAQ